MTLDEETPRTAQAIGENDQLGKDLQGSLSSSKLLLISRSYDNGCEELHSVLFTEVLAALHEACNVDLIIDDELRNTKRPRKKKKTYQYVNCIALGSVESGVTPIGNQLEQRLGQRAPKLAVLSQCAHVVHSLALRAWLSALDLADKSLSLLSVGSGLRQKK